MRIALTSSAGRLEGLAEALRARGCDVVHQPLLAPRVRDDDTTRAAALGLLHAPWRAYPSRSSVEAWQALALPLDDGARLAAVGPGTAEALRAAGATQVLTPDATAANAAGLARSLLAAGASGSVVALVQGGNARPELAQRLRAGGAEPHTVIVYDVAPVPWQADGAFDSVLLASPSGVASLPPDVAARSRLVALGPTTAAAIEARGWSCTRAPEPTVQGALVALCHGATAARTAAAEVAP